MFSAGSSSAREGRAAASLALLLIDSELLFSPGYLLKISALTCRVKLLRQPSAPTLVVSTSFKDGRMKREALLFLKPSYGGCRLRAMQMQPCRTSLGTTSLHSQRFLGHFL